MCSGTCDPNLGLHQLASEPNDPGSVGVDYPYPSIHPVPSWYCHQPTPSLNLTAPSEIQPINSNHPRIQTDRPTTPKPYSINPLQPITLPLPVNQILYHKSYNPTVPISSYIHFPVQNHKPSAKPSPPTPPSRSFPIAVTHIQKSSIKKAKRRQKKGRSRGESSSVPGTACQQRPPSVQFHLHLLATIGPVPSPSFSFLYFYGAENKEKGFSALFLYFDEEENKEKGFGALFLLQAEHK